jgi:molybdopterin synthase catalytic subunit
MAIEVRISKEKIDVSKAIESVMMPGCGGIASFIGTIRDSFEGKDVKRVNVEAYDEMALADLRRIATELSSEKGIGGITIVHRTGSLEVGEVVVAVAVSAPHRKEAFDVCQSIIDRLKQTTPIWKQEFFDEGSRWIGGDSK